MNAIARPWLVISYLLIQSSFPLFCCSSPEQRHLHQSSTARQNVQAFPSIAIPAFTKLQSPPPSNGPPPPLSLPRTTRNSDKTKIAAAVVSTAVSSFAISGLFFFVFHRFYAKKNPRPEPRVSNIAEPAAGAATPADPFASKAESSLKGVIVGENGIDVLYWRDLHDPSPMRCDHCNRLLQRGQQEEAKPQNRRQRNWDQGQETPLLPSDSVDSSSLCFSQESNWNSSPSLAPFQSVTTAPIDNPTPTKSQPAPPPPPPPAPRAPPAPPPPPPRSKRPQPLVPQPPRRAAAEPPPPPSSSSSKQPLLSETGRGRPRLKPLHWDKVTPANAGRSMVWDRINDGSINFDDDVMETLFGYVAANRSQPKPLANEFPSVGSSCGAAESPAQISFLEARKSQNISIILRTLAASRQEIVDGLRDGQGLSADTLEKLARIAPSKEEEALIVQFSGDPSKLSDAESFLFHLLRVIPTAFSRVEALHFRSSIYYPELQHLKQSLQTLELACKELRTRGLLLKLLEAILKAGNRMNAGTSRGNAQAFDLSALRKLSDVKSTDGNTTLLHFVVEEVVRSEGKRCAALKRNHSIGRTANLNSGNLGELKTREEREMEYMMLGLPVVGGLSVEFTNVMKAAPLDYDSLSGGCAALAARVSDTRQLLRLCGEKDEDFVREMLGFLHGALREVEELREEQSKVMEIVRRTTEYYQPGAASKEKAAEPLQLFVIMRDFLSMVDQACIDITRNLQKRKKKKTNKQMLSAIEMVTRQVDSPPESVPPQREKRIITARFPNLPARFVSDAAISSDSEEEF
ncbi:hypothetical protein HPP92_010510 [Vanilla planifolia]|uniref:Formin-like protein n=1 Tax=Vanilla planifolia TaxID=51239 RepID=A0A835R5B9_VANPL|nr:hypothetical protein HPP92_010510 [Vanilla planifolia]